MTFIESFNGWTILSGQMEKLTFFQDKSGKNLLISNEESEILLSIVLSSSGTSLQFKKIHWSLLFEIFPEEKKLCLFFSEEEPPSLYH